MLAAATAAAQPLAPAPSPPTATAAGDRLPPPPEHYFNDYAGVVAPADARRLEQKLKRFAEETSTQVVVAVFPELPSESLEDFTARTAEAWKVGRKERDNGAVLFVFVNDRKIRLEVGYGLEGALPDATARRIIDDVIAPRFREGRYGQGLEAGTDAILAATRGEYTAVKEKSPADNGALLLLLPLGFIGLIFLLSRRLGGPVGPIARNRRRRRVWYIGPGGFGGGFGGGGGWSGGGGGGFRGGGGSFGGGGASGGW